MAQTVSPKVILTDVDDCVLAWSAAFKKWLPENSRHDPQTDLETFPDIEAWLGCDLDETWELIRKFNLCPDHWPNFEPLPDAVHYIKLLNEMGYKFVAITACATDIWTWEQRWYNLRKVFGDAFDTLHTVGLHSTKDEILARYKPTYWVEDKWRHAIAGADLGHHPFLMSYGHNSDDLDSRVMRVNSWKDIYESILEDESLDNEIGHEVYFAK